MTVHRRGEAGKDVINRDYSRGKIAAVGTRVASQDSEIKGEDVLGVDRMLQLCGSQSDYRRDGAIWYVVNYHGMHTSPI